MNTLTLLVLISVIFGINAQCGSKVSFDWALAYNQQDFRSCCTTHDACYDTCGKKKIDCDWTFYVCMKNICRPMSATEQQLGSHPGTKQKSACLEKASNFYWAVRNYGHDAYNNAQAKCRG